MKLGEKVVDLSIHKILGEGIIPPARSVVEGSHVGELLPEVGPEDRILARRGIRFQRKGLLLKAVT